MPSIDTMFSRKYMSFSDFSPDVVYFGTIRAVTKVPNRFGPEPVWEIWFHDWTRAMRCSPGKAEVIAKVLGTRVTEEWAGQRIGFVRGVVPLDGDYVDALLIHPEAVGPDGAVVTVRSNMCLSPKLAGTRIPEADLRAALEKAKKHGADWSAFIAWLRNRCREGHDLVVGEPLDRIDGAITPGIKIWLDELAGVKEPGAKRETFKASKAAGSAFAAAGSPYEQIHPDDIPF